MHRNSRGRRRRRRRRRRLRHCSLSSLHHRHPAAAKPPHSWGCFLSTPRRDEEEAEAAKLQGAEREEPPPPPRGHLGRRRQLAQSRLHAAPFWLRPIHILAALAGEGGGLRARTRGGRNQSRVWEGGTKRRWAGQAESSAHPPLPVLRRAPHPRETRLGPPSPAFPPPPPREGLESAVCTRVRAALVVFPGLLQAACAPFLSLPSRSPSQPDWRLTVPSFRRQSLRAKTVLSPPPQRVRGERGKRSEAELLLIKLPRRRDRAAPAIGARKGSRRKSRRPRRPRAPLQPGACSIRARYFPGLFFF